MSETAGGDLQAKLVRLAELRREIAELEADLDVAPLGEPAVMDELADEELCRLIITHTHDLITVHELNGDYLWISPNCEEFLGVPRDHLIGTNAYALFHPEDVERISRDHAATLETSESRVTYRLRQGDGSYRWAETRSYTRPAATGVPRMVAITRDIHEQYVAQEEARESERRLRGRLVALATTDRLTQLPNRRSGEQTLRRETSRARRSARQLAIAILDVDRFKSLNDTHGHLAGDRALKAIAARIRDTLREYDHVSRWGGEEFLAVLPEASAEEALQSIERVRAAVASIAHEHGERVTISAGVGTVTEGEGPDDALARVDRALYRAKESGRNRVEPAE